jgi:hypothetical protein
MKYGRTRQVGSGLGTIGRKSRRSGTLQPLMMVAWTLPSGKPLAEFALQAGFLAPPLLTIDGRVGDQSFPVYPMTRSRS